MHRLHSIPFLKNSPFLIIKIYIFIPFRASRERQQSFAFYLTNNHKNGIFQAANVSDDILRHNMWPAVMVLLVCQEWHHYLEK